MNRLAYETATQNPAMPETGVKGWSLEKDPRLMGGGGGEGEADERGRGCIPLRHTPWQASLDELRTTERGERQRQALRNHLMKAVLEGIPAEDDSQKRGASQQAMEKASLFVDHLGELKEIPHITVADDGEISLYWNGNEVTVEIAFPSDGSVEYYVNKDGKRQAGELCLTPIGWRTEQAGALEDALSMIRAQQA